MAQEKSSFKLVAYAVLLLLLIFGLIRIFVKKSGMFFNYELLGFIMLLLLTIVGLAGYRKVWGERVLFFVFLLYLLNLVLVWYFNGDLYIVLLFLALVGFVLSVPKQFMRKKKKGPKQKVSSEEPHSEVFDLPGSKQKEVSREEKVIRAPVKKVATKTEFVPGKYVASKRSNVYHIPKCDWAKKIYRNSRVWFRTKEEAWEKGYKKHSCVE